MPDSIYFTSYVHLLAFLGVIAAFVFTGSSLTILRCSLVLLCVTASVSFVSNFVMRGITDSAFGPQGAGALFSLISLLPVAYYLFCIATAFSRVPRRPVAAVIHFCAAAFFVFLNSLQPMPGMGDISMRIAMSLGGVLGMLPLILIWMRIYDLRTRHGEGGAG